MVAIAFLDILILFPERRLPSPVDWGAWVGRPPVLRVICPIKLGMREVVDAVLVMGGRARRRRLAGKMQAPTSNRRMVEWAQWGTIPSVIMEAAAVLVEVRAAQDTQVENGEAVAVVGEDRKRLPVMVGRVTREP
jgi:hypothetical protein